MWIIIYDACFKHTTAGRGFRHFFSMKPMGRALLIQNENHRSSQSHTQTCPFCHFRNGAAALPTLRGKDSQCCDTAPHEGWWSFFVAGRGHQAAAVLYETGCQQSTWGSFKNSLFNTNKSDVYKGGDPPFGSWWVGHLRIPGIAYKPLTLGMFSTDVSSDFWVLWYLPESRSTSSMILIMMLKTLKPNVGSVFWLLPSQILRNTSNPLHVQLPGIHTRWLNQSEGSQDPPLNIEMNGVVSTPISILISYYRMKIHEHQLFCETMWKLLGLNRSPVVKWRYASAAAVDNMPFPNPACATNSLIERWTVDGQGEPWLDNSWKSRSTEPSWTCWTDGDRW